MILILHVKLLIVLPQHRDNETNRGLNLILEFLFLISVLLNLLLLSLCMLVSLLDRDRVIVKLHL